jgi:DNA repair exonuclease SbcCD ATPase subunit
MDFDINDIYFENPRSVANLSGGERFLVSLSFALAISEFASKNVRVDSLFLDEGFGTLSGELLTEAINALKNLQKDGKMLGIITHVQNVIDEIEQKIEVKPVSLGHSVLSGSGISSKN